METKEEKTHEEASSDTNGHNLRNENKQLKL